MPTSGTLFSLSAVNDLGQLAPRRWPGAEHRLGCSTSAKKPYYNQEWGQLMGSGCERVRWRDLRSDSNFLIFPRLPQAESFVNNSNTCKGSSGIEVLLDLKGAHMQALKRDELFSEFAEYQCNCCGWYSLLAGPMVNVVYGMSA